MNAMNTFSLFLARYRWEPLAKSLFRLVKTVDCHLVVMGVVVVMAVEAAQLTKKEEGLGNPTETRA